MTSGSDTSLLSPWRALRRTWLNIFSLTWFRVQVFDWLFSYGGRFRHWLASLVMGWSLRRDFAEDEVNRVEMLLKKRAGGVRWLGGPHQPNRVTDQVSGSVRGYKETLEGPRPDASSGSSRFDSVPPRRLRSHCSPLWPPAPPCRRSVCCFSCVLLLIWPAATPTSDVSSTLITQLWLPTRLTTQSTRRPLNLNRYPPLNANPSTDRWEADTPGLRNSEDGAFC